MTPVIRYLRAYVLYRLRKLRRWKCPAGHPEHTWIYYHSSETRWCHDCHREEKLWADFGLTKKGQSDGSK